ncbi:MAG: hypothetical protein P3A28_01615 [Gemmatimonadota bacterium]|nr:hypothetical protein [Gemmatimonadota bacterium]
MPHARVTALAVLALTSSATPLLANGTVVSAHAVTRSVHAAATTTVGANAANAATAHAARIPAFARKYKISCSVCHAPVPKLTATGEAFAGNGFEFEVGEEPRDTVATGDNLLRLQNSVPLGIRMDAYASLLTKSSGGKVANDLQTPWVMKLLSGGQISDKISYYAYFLLGERGEVGGLEDAYIQFTDIRNSGVSVIVGQFQVSDPLFKRELRLMYDDYQPYRVRVGKTIADLTYDRGVMALWSPWAGGDLSASVVAGRGLNHANDQRQYDGDNDKNVALRYTQDIGKLRLGMYGYTGREKQNDRYNQISIWGPDATLALGSKTELNLQYLVRKDDDPFYGTCTTLAPCPGGHTRAFGTTVKSGFAEAVISPQGPTGRWFITGLYNWVQSDDPVVSLRLGEQATAPGYVSDYRTAAGALHFVYRRNVRMLGEISWDLEREVGRLITGLVVGF